jgi:O-antigen ligase
MYWFIILFPLLIYPWTHLYYYSIPKVFYLDFFVICVWCTLLVKRRIWNVNISIKLLTIEKVLAVFLGLVFLSSLFSVNIVTSFIGSSLRYEGLFTFVSYVSVFIFSYRILNNNKLRKVLPGIVIVSLVASVYGILQHYSLDFLPGRPFNGAIRSESFFDNANFFGAYLVLVITLASTLYITAKRNMFIIFLFVTICISFSSMIFSDTRSAWLGWFTAMAILSLGVILKRKNLWKRWIVLLLSLTAIFIFINVTEQGGTLNRLFSAVSQPYKAETNEEKAQDGSSVRLYIWKKSLPLIGPNFWLGSGPDTFIEVFPSDTKESKEILAGSKVDKAHNEYLQIAITLGIPALITYLLFVFMILRNAFKALKVIQGNDKILLYGLISTIIGYLIQAFFNISVVSVAPIYWSILGITYGISYYYINQAKAQNSSGTMKGTTQSA